MRFYIWDGIIWWQFTYDSFFSVSTNYLVIILLLKQENISVERWIMTNLFIAYPDEEIYWMLGLFEFFVSSCLRWVMQRFIFLADPEVIVTMLLKNHINPKVTAICTRIQVPIHSIQTFRNLRILLKSKWKSRSVMNVVVVT